MNDSCVVPLIEIDMEIGDTHYIWEQNGVKGYDPKAILIPGKLHCFVYVSIMLLEWVLNHIMTYNVFQGVYKFLSL